MTNRRTPAARTPRRPQRRRWLLPAAVLAGLAVLGVVVLLNRPAEAPAEPGAGPTTAAEVPAPSASTVQPSRQPGPAPPPEPAPGQVPAGGPFPIVVTLDRPQTVTVVIEDASGLRVRNLVSETPLPAGRNVLEWDGYDDGRQEGKDGPIVRRLAGPGSYRARGLTHDGLKTTYEFTVHNGGDPPWSNATSTGGWLADHSCPLGACFIPAGSAFGNGQPQVLMSALVSEAGRNLIWLGLDGRVLHRTTIWGWDAGMAVAYDVGPAADRKNYAYLLMCWGEKKDVIVRGLAGEKGADLVKFTPKNPNPKEPRTEGFALAVRDALAAVTVPNDDEVVLVDLAARRVLGALPVPKPRGVHFDAQGRLLVSSAGTVRRFTLTRTGKGMPGADAGPVLIPGLEDPRTIAADPAGKELFVADWGRSHQVKVFTPDGKPGRVIGKAGGFQLGAYDDQRMHQPCGLAIDDRSQLWVAEADWYPKRVSRWDAATGKLTRTWIGPPQYGGGGTLDSTDKTRFLYGTYQGMIEFKIDYAKRTSTVVAIPHRMDVQGFDELPGEGFTPERLVHAGGRTYIVGGLQSKLRTNTNFATFLYDDKTRIARPVSFVGSYRWWRPIAQQNLNGLRDEIRKRSGSIEPLLAWSDLDGDGKPTIGEFTFRTFTETFTDAKGSQRPTFGYREFCPRDDLSYMGSWGIVVPKPEIRADGVPLYDLSKAAFTMPARDDMHWTEDGYGTFQAADGTIVQAFRGWKDGRWAWTYPVFHEKLPTNRPGQVLEPTRLLGPAFTMPAGEAGELMCINGEKGNMFLLTTDGLYVQTLGGDMRSRPLMRFPKAEPGMDVTGFSFEDEHFHPTISLTKDGEVYLVAGKEHSSLFRVHNLESVRRRQFGSLVLAEKDLAGLPPTRTIPLRQQVRQVMQVAVRNAAPVVDGRLDDWASAAWVPIGDRATGALAVHGDRLYAAWRTNDPEALRNNATDPAFAFKRGGCVDLMLGRANRGGSRNPVDGDLRLLATMIGGKPVAVLYRPVASGGKRVLFESPVGKVEFADVREVGDLVRLAVSGGDVELSVPLALVGMPGQAGRRMTGDLGVLRGDGVATVQRSYWNNLDTTMVSDIPTEARLQPFNWGDLEVVAP